MYKDRYFYIIYYLFRLILYILVYILLFSLYVLYVYEQLFFHVIKYF